MKNILVLFLTTFFFLSCNANVDKEEKPEKQQERRVVQVEAYIQKIDAYVEKLPKKSQKISQIQKKVQQAQEKLLSKEWKNIQKAQQILQYFSDSLGKKLDEALVYEEQQDYEKNHIPLPKKVKSLYYTSGGIQYSPKYNNLLQIAKNKEINSVTLDIKTVSGYTNFSFDEKYFGTIKPVSNGSIKDIKKLVQTLHDEGIYVVGRIVVFKDARLADLRPDLAVKRLDRTWEVWTDYQGKKFVDPAAEEIWDYHANMAIAAYDLGFDEINFDYVRYPTDGRLSNSYYPVSKISGKNHLYFDKIEVLDRFSHTINKKIKQERPRLYTSADIFWLVTNQDGRYIGQNLESFFLYFDFIGPMIYPSHYANGYLGAPVADNIPYAIFADSLRVSEQRIKKLNAEILLAQQENRPVKIYGMNTAGKYFETAWDVTNFEEISFTKMRPWVQGFTCTWCKGATPYNRTKFREQLRTIEATEASGFYVWSSGNNYYEHWYDAE